MSREGSPDFFEQLDGSIASLDEFIRVLSYRERKSNNLNNTAEDVLSSVEAVYHELERVVLFDCQADLEPIQIKSVLLNIYKPLTGASFAAYADLMKLLKSLISNYIKHIKKNKDMKEKLAKQASTTKTLRDALKFLNRKIADYLKVLSEKEPEYQKDYDWIQSELNRLKLD